MSVSSAISVTFSSFPDPAMCCTTTVGSVGNSVTFEQSLAPGSIARVIASPALADVPRFFEGIGTLLLDETQLSFLPGFVVVGANGLAWTPYGVPNDPGLIGTSVYFQGLGLRPRRLSEHALRMTILP